jgi:hypothetical protein
MFRFTTLILALSILPLATTADAQGRNNRNRLDRREGARAQGAIAHPATRLPAKASTATPRRAPETQRKNIMDIL